MKYITRSAEETKNVARELAKSLKGGEFVALIGDLGAGKTTFVQGLVEALGSTARVKSPTFTVMNEYKVEPPKNGIARVVHVDFYRFSEEGELSALSLEDEKRQDTVILAEWPNVFEKTIFTPDLTIILTHKGSDEREIQIDKT